MGDLVWVRGQKVERPIRIFSEDTARQINLFLSDPMARLPSFPRMGWNEYPFPVAVKTGTSSNYRDAWTVAFSSRYLVGVWVGHPDYHPMSRVSGYRAAAKLTHSIMNYLHRDQQDGLEDLGFPPPRGTRAVRLCALTGKLATDACDRISLEYLRVGEEPVAPCDAHLRLAVDTRDGRVASSRTPTQFREVRTFVQLPPLYAAWSAQAGLPRPPMQGSGSGKRTPRGPERLIYGQPVSIRIASPKDGLRLMRRSGNPGGHVDAGLESRRRSSLGASPLVRRRRSLRAHGFPLYRPLASRARRAHHPSAATPYGRGFECGAGAGRVASGGQLAVNAR